MKTYFTIQESGGEGDKQGEGDDGMEGKWEEGIIRSKYSWEQTRSEKRIVEMGGMIGWREI